MDWTRRMQDEVLLAETSPNGNIQAIVEQDDRVAYLYLVADDDLGFPMRACWIRNLEPAPTRMDVRALHEGLPPMMPEGACAHPSGAPPLDPRRLRVVWFEEGDGVALVDELDDDELLAVIPGLGWANGVPGFARDCVDERPLAWPLRDEGWLRDRVECALDFWESWQDGDIWPELQDAFVTTYEATFGAHDRYYAIDGGQWPPRALLRIPTDEAWILVTLGVCIRPQPSVSYHSANPRDLQRIELGMAIARDTDDLTLRRAMTYLSSQSGYPWQVYEWLGEGHTCPCDAFPAVGDRPGFPYALLTGAPAGAPTLSVPDYRGDLTNLLWVVPITEAERALAMASGSEVLRHRLGADGPYWIHRRRGSLA